MLWLGYARAGKELEVQDALTEMGITAHCARIVEAKRVGKRRRPDVFIDPLLPNYLFIDCTDAEYLDVIGVKHLAGTMAMIPKADVGEVMAFLSRAQSALDERLARLDAGERLEQFSEGDLLEIIGGRLTGLTARFRRILDGDRGAFPSIVAEMEGMGRTVETKLDVLHVRKVG